MKKYCLIIVFICLLLSKSYSQISPPGLGKTNTADWLALGVRQKMDTLKGVGWESMTYIGLGRKSNPDNYNPFLKQAIWVLNQEFYHQFHKNWQYSLALSYRRQDKYIEDEPYRHDDPKLKQEIRLYNRFSYLFTTSRIKFVPTFRQEFRKFYSLDFKNFEENVQFRWRFRLQLTANLNHKKTHRLILSSEQLFSISKEVTPSKWTDFNYRESRFSFYYSYSPSKTPFVFSIGYMNNLVGSKKIDDVHYLAFDIVIVNPFKK